MMATPPRDAKANSFLLATDGRAEVVGNRGKSGWRGEVEIGTNFVLCGKATIRRQG